MYKKFIIIIIVALITGLIIVSCLFYKQENNNKNENIEKINELDTLISNSKDTEIYYMLRLNDNNLLAFKNEDNHPFLSIEVTPQLLPENDRNRLIIGERVNSYDDLLKKIEDYTS